MDATYLFYDIETTGLNKSFDQILQFACIRTDLSLNELSREQFLVKLTRDITPSPMACLTHGISLTECNEKGLTELEAVQKIHQLVNTPGTISCGYNTLGFDDEFLRFSFYRHLLTPYTHQYANQCKRLDIYPMTALYYLYKPNILKWPTVDGKTSLKLENLNRDNQLADGPAHDAMVDVLATLALARRLYAEKEMWDYLLGYFDKNTDTQRLAALPNAWPNQPYRLGLWTSGRLGEKNQYQVPVLGLGPHKHYKNKTVWLRLDNEAVQDINETNIPDTTYGVQKKTGEPAIILPPSERFMSKLDAKRLTLMHNNLNFFNNNPSLLDKTTHHHIEYTYPETDNVDVDAALYLSGFLSAAEQHQCTTFLSLPPEKKINALKEFQRPRLQEQALRILARHFPELLTQSERETFQNNITNEHIDYRGEHKNTPKIVLNEIKTLRKKELSDMQHRQLDELERIIKKRIVQSSATQSTSSS